MTDSRGNPSRSRRANGTAGPRLFCTATNAVSNCCRKLLWRSAATKFPITNPISSRTARAAPAHRMDAPGLAQHRLLRRGTVLRRYEPHRRQILPRRRQVPVLGLRLPQGGPFRQPQLGPSEARFPLFARQPVAQGVDEVVVRELIVLSARQGRQAVARGTFRVGGRDQAKLRVKDVDQIIEVAGAVGITGRFEQFLRAISSVP